MERRAFRSTVCEKLESNAETAGALAKDCNTVRITSKEMDILFDPFESEPLVFETNVEIVGISEDRRGSESKNLGFISQKLS